ncbi:MAG: TlpA family protein disulfide reductase [Bacteroidetes bacterium]|nr:TlpA family protein disulfide reductase [Bacteroidota bacterium]MCW5896225.1 TlpA family protein disulfide reductase [Bacteroidota bacterium]
MSRCQIVYLLLFVVLVLSSKAYSQSSSITQLKLDGLDGTRSVLSEYLKKGPVYMNFWALWCEPCKLELRALKSFAKEHEDGAFTILAVNLDSPKSIAKVKSYVRSQSYPFPVMLDPNSQVFQALNGQNLPFAVLIDKSGKVVSARTGFLPGDEKEIADEILKLSMMKE